MGICASCLGWDKEEDEGDSTNPLLFDDPTTNYGSLSLPEHTPPASTVADARKDRELEFIVNLAAQKLIPIYDFPDHQGGGVREGQGTYGELLKKFSSEDLGEVEAVDDGWGSGSDDEDNDGGGGVEGSNGGPSYAQVVKRDRPDIGPCTTTLKAEEGM